MQKYIMVGSCLYAMCVCDCLFVSSSELLRYVGRGAEIRDSILELIWVRNEKAFCLS